MFAYSLLPGKAPGPLAFVAGGRAGRGGLAVSVAGLSGYAVGGVVQCRTDGSWTASEEILAYSQNMPVFLLHTESLEAHVVDSPAVAAPALLAARCLSTFVRSF